MGPSGSAFRSRSQTSPSCRGKEAWWWEMKGEMKGQHTYCSNSGRYVSGPLISPATYAAPTGSNPAATKSGI